MRRDDSGLWQPPPHLRRDRQLVSRIAKREKQTDGDRLGVELRERIELEPLDHPIRPSPFADAEAALQRNEWRRLLGAEPVEVGPVLTPQVQQVLETFGGNERGADLRRPRIGDLILFHAHLRSSSALVATVVPCAKRSAPAASTAAAAASTDSSCRRAVGILAVRNSFSSVSRTASVNVPPTSTPRIAT